MHDLLALKPMQLDALREVANIGAGHAATALSQMTGQVIMISVPTINISPATLPNATVGLAYGPVSITASGGTAPYVFTLVSGLTVVAMSDWGMGAAGGVLVGLGVGVLTGLINGSLVATGRASSFIITLAWVPPTPG